MEELIEALASHKTFGPVVEFFTGSNSFIAIIIIAVFLLFIINSLAKEHFDRNLLVSLMAILRGKSKDEKNRISREIFYEQSTKKEFVEWQGNVLKKVYGDLPLVSLFGKTHMSVAQRAAEEVYYPFEEKLKNSGELISLDIPELST